QRNYVVHQRDPLYPNIPYPSRMHKQKQQDKDEIQIHKFWQMFKQLHINITLADALILIIKYQKMLKALLFNKEKLLKLANTPLNEIFLVVILKKLPEKLRDPRKFLIPCGFSKLKYKALADLGASINLMPHSVWKKLSLPELISTRMTLELANWAICTPAGIVRDVFVLVGNIFHGIPKPPATPTYQKMLKALLSNKEKLLELANTPLNENCSAVILKKLPEKLGDPGKFLIPCGFSLPELISTQMTLELANRAICTPAGIARDVFVSVGKFTFPADFVIVDYESDPRVSFILGRPFLRTARALIDVHGEEMILRDGDERLTLNMRH
nr:reverse transcriptase domain-containing protein [Tanacetum cinerariifolium]